MSFWKIGLDEINYSECKSDENLVQIHTGVNPEVYCKTCVENLVHTIKCERCGCDPSAKVGSLGADKTYYGDGKFYCTGCAKDILSNSDYEERENPGQDVLDNDAKEMARDWNNDRKT